LRRNAHENDCEALIVIGDKLQARQFQAATSLLQRKSVCGGTPGQDDECAEYCKKRLQRRSTGLVEPTIMPSIVHDVLRSSGRPLDPAIPTFMEAPFGYEFFSRVRVHGGTGVCAFWQGFMKRKLTSDI
jgi:hypothetical protein